MSLTNKYIEKGLDPPIGFLNVRYATLDKQPSLLSTLGSVKNLSTTYIMTYLAFYEEPC